MASHPRRSHYRQGRPVRATVAHHKPGRVPAPRGPSEPRSWDAVKVAGHAVAVSVALVVVYLAAAVLSLTAALLCGITTWALTEVGVYQRRKRRRRRPLVLSRRRRRQLRVHKLRRQFEQSMWRPVQQRASQWRSREDNPEDSGQEAMW